MKTKKARFESEQKDRILNAVVRVFGEKGYKGATIRSIGRAAKVNSALLYYYYENKHTLFTESVRMILGEFLETVATRRRPFSSVRERLTYLVDCVFDYYTEYPDRMRLMAFSISVHPDLFAEALNAIVQEKVLVPLDVLNEGMENGELRRTPPVHAWWSIIGMCMFSLLTRDLPLRVRTPEFHLPAFNAAERKRHIVDLLMLGLANYPTKERTS